MRFKLENISYMSHVPISDLSHMLWIGPLGRSDIGLARNDKIWYVVVVVVGLPSFRPRFAGKCGRQSRDLTQSHQSY